MKIPSHRNCTHILPGGEYIPGRTHGCWCSSWKQEGDTFLIWRDGRWQPPKNGELRIIYKETTNN